MPVKIFKNLIEVNNRLEQLGLNREKLLEVVEAMLAARADCTPNDPPGSRGWSSWRMGTRRMREEFLVEDGWERDETDQISSIVNKKLGVRIVVANTDNATGIDHDGCIPQNSSKKGIATDRAVHVNQLSFMEKLDESVNIVALKSLPNASRPIITLYLCVYDNGDEFRAELSCPAGLDGGFFTDFRERVFLNSSDDSDGNPVRRRAGGDDDGGSEFNIPVTRKK
jgi:hypothetical protein